MSLEQLAPIKSELLTTFVSLDTWQSTEFSVVVAQTRGAFDQVFKLLRDTKQPVAEKREMSGKMFNFTGRYHK